MFTKGTQPGIRTLFWIVLSIIMMVLDQRADVEALRSAIAAPISILQYVVSWPITVIDNVGTEFSTHRTLVKENAALKTEELLLKAQVERLLAVEAENARLKALLHSAADKPGKVLIAQLLAVNSDPFISVVLNKGSKDGVYVGQPVLDAYGVMGKVIKVSLLTSTVLLLNDSHSGIPVQVSRNGVLANAMGDSFTRKMRLVNVPQTADIRVGDVLLTSGLSIHFPAGYPVGQVVNVTKDPGLQFSAIEVEPSGHLDRSRQVLLLWPNGDDSALQGVQK